MRTDAINWFASSELCRSLQDGEKTPLTEERARLDKIIHTKHELVQLAGKLDWDWLDGEIAPLYSDSGRPGIETRFVIGLLLLKHIFALSDEEVCERWVYDPFSSIYRRGVLPTRLPARAR